MSIVTFQDVLREKIDNAELKFSNSVRPIHGINKGSLPSHIGTCTLISINNSEYLLTAAHIIDENDHTPLHITNDHGKFLGIEGKFKITESTTGQRRDDKFDFAFMELSEEGKKNLGDIHFISIDEMSLNDVYKSGKRYLAIGYPSSKNKSISAKNRKVKSQKYFLHSTLTDEPTLFTELQVHKKSHLLLKYNRDNVGESNGEQVATFHPKGMSGGGLFLIGDPSNLEDFAKNEESPKLVGMIIEYHKDKNVLIATRITEIIENIKKFI